MKRPAQAYTPEFKELAVKRIKDGQSVSKVCKELGMSDQTLRNWVKAAAEGKLNGAGGRIVTPEEMELSRPRAENLKLKRENGILKKRRRTSQGMFREARLD
jgi:transposase